MGDPRALSFDDDRGCLSLHVAKANPQWQKIDNKHVLFVVNGPHGYISPSWYVDPGVPTWNYQAMHFSGIAKAFSDTEKLRALVDQLTANAESRFADPWQSDYPDSMLKGIVGIEIKVTALQCKFKLSQNRSTQDQTQSIAALEMLGNRPLAQAMREENKLD